MCMYVYIYIHAHHTHIHTTTVTKTMITIMIIIRTLRIIVTLYNNSKIDDNIHWWHTFMYTHISTSTYIYIYLFYVITEGGIYYTGREHPEWSRWHPQAWASTNAPQVEGCEGPRFAGSLSHGRGGRSFFGGSWLTNSKEVHQQNGVKEVNISIISRFWGMESRKLWNWPTKIWAFYQQTMGFTRNNRRLNHSHMGIHPCQSWKRKWWFLRSHGGPCPVFAARIPTASVIRRLERRLIPLYMWINDATKCYKDL